MKTAREFIDEFLTHSPSMKDKEGEETQPSKRKSKFRKSKPRMKKGQNRFARSEPKR